MTTSGSPTFIHNFGSGSDGNRSAAPLLHVHGTLYGTTELGGAYGKGILFRMSLSGKEKVLHSFGNGSDGATPLAGFIDVNGTLYGTTSAGGANGNGTH
ncbi:MAG: choice-of-anchor tandem repeat GloVer-containing protein [Candidatus Cybelea sp.]